jgi:hypothetical protein
MPDLAGADIRFGDCGVLVIFVSNGLQTEEQLSWRAHANDLFAAIGSTAGYLHNSASQGIYAGTGLPLCKEYFASGKANLFHCVGDQTAQFRAVLVQLVKWTYLVAAVHFFPVISNSL